MAGRSVYGGASGYRAEENRAWIEDRVQEQIIEMWPGRPYPLGATFDGTGVNFALFSEAASKVELCLIDDDGQETCVELIEVDGYVWHAYLPRIQPGQRYATGFTAPTTLPGHRCNPSKLLLDPYAKAISGQIDGHESLFSYRFSDPTAFNDLDLFGHTMLSVVTPVLRLGPRSTTAAPVSREHHLRDAPEGSHEDSSGHSGRDPRSYAAMRHPAIIEHLTSLGITAVELLPVHQFVNDTHLRSWSV